MGGVQRGIANRLLAWMAAQDDLRDLDLSKMAQPEERAALVERWLRDQTPEHR